MELNGITSQLISLALDAAILRHEVISNNIANCDTPGYRAKQLRFESLLGDISSRIKDREDDAISSRLEAVQSSLQDGSAVTFSENGLVELDREMVRLTENAIWYQAVLKAGAKQGELLRLAIDGGRQ